MAEITPELISRIVSGDTTLEDLNLLKSMFGSSEMTPLRKEFVAILERNLSDDALHKFNSKVMEFSVELAVTPDTKFMYRTPDMKFFQEMLVVEARREGMRVELSENGVGNNSLLADVPPKIKEHYATLSKTLHNKHGDANNNDVMAEVISWGLTASLARESDYYKKLDENAQGQAELVIDKETKQTKRTLTDTNILDRVKATAVTDLTVAKPERSQVETTTNAIIDSYKATQKSLEIIRGSLDPAVKTSNAGIKVEGALLESVKQIPYDTLQNNEAKALQFLKSNLSKKMKKGELSISNQELQQLKEGFLATCSGHEQELSRGAGFVDKILSTLKNLRSYFSEVIARFSRTENQVPDKRKEVSAAHVNGLEETVKLEAEKLGNDILKRKESPTTKGSTKVPTLPRNRSNSSELQR